MRTWLVPPTLRGYARSWLLADVLAGITLVAIAIPEQLANARLAGMPASTGLVAFVAGSVVFALLGRSRSMSVGADSTTAPVLATAVLALALAGTADYQHLMAVLALMAGAAVVAIGAFRMGWIAEFLSTPVITGLLCGIAVQIVVRELPAALGLPGGGTTTMQRLRAIANERGHVNGWCVAIAAGVLLVTLVAGRIDRRIPGALVGLLASTVLVATLDLATHGVALLGRLHGGLPTVAVPEASWGEIRQLAAPALVVAFLCVAQTAAVIRGTTMAGAPTTADFNADLLAIGGGSVVAGLGGAFAVNASPPRSEALATSGARSQAAGLVAAAVTLAVLVAATGLLEDVPQAAIAGILIYIATRLFQRHALRSVLHFSRFEFALATVTLLVVALYGIEQGVIVALVLALADRTRRTARPRDAILGREPGTDHWVPSGGSATTEVVPGVLVYLVYAPVWYGNADFVRLRINHLVATAPQPLRALVLDADGVPDVDYTGALALLALAHDLRRRGMVLAIARSSEVVRGGLERGGVLAEIGPERLYESVEGAVEALGRGAR